MLYHFTENESQYRCTSTCIILPKTKQNKPGCIILLCIILLNTKCLKKACIILVCDHFGVFFLFQNVMYHFGVYHFSVKRFL